MSELKSIENFDYLAAESSSVFKVNQYQIQFYWHINVLEELESFGFKYSGETEKQLEAINSELASANATSVNEALRQLVDSNILPMELQLTAKMALDEYFNYEVKNFQSDLICRCFGIGPDQLIGDLQKGDTCTVDAWKEKYLVTMGCGTCGADIEKFFRESMDNPQFEEGEAFQKCRYSKFLPITAELEDAEKVLIRPMGKTPFEFLKFLKTCPELDGCDVLETTGYQVKLKDEGQDLIALSQLMQSKYQLKIKFIF